MNKSIVLPQYLPLPDEYNNIGQLLKEYRTKNNLSSREMARLLEVCDKNVQNWEKGGMPSVGNYNKILGLLKRI